MKYRFFTIPVQASDAAAMALNQLLAEQRILAVEREFIADGCNSAWAFCIGYDEAGCNPPAAEAGKVDYNDNLGFRCARAQAGAGWPLSEQTFVPVISIEMTKPSGGGCVSSRYGESSLACLPHWRERCALVHGGVAQ